MLEQSGKERKMSNVIDESRRIERNGRSPIHSHQKGYSPDVETICHHSGRYLTQAETNPTLRFLLKIQNDFPGLPKLDAFFDSEAKHSAQHEHWIWSKHAVQGLALLITGTILIYLYTLNEQLSDFVSIGIWLQLFRGGLVVALLFGIIIAIYGIYLIGNKKALFHSDSQSLGPATPDFPIECKYEIQIQEDITATLGNVVVQSDILTESKGQISTTVLPISNDYETFDEYQTRYASHNVGQYMIAGAIGLEKLQGIQFKSENVEFDHRILLRGPSSLLKYNAKTDTYDPFTLQTAYEIESDFLFPLNDGLPQFPISCIPSISHRDSRRLYLTFRFDFPKNKYPDKTQLILQECIITEISEDYLQPVTFVENGRYDTENNRIIWRNLQFEQINPLANSATQSWELKIGVSFEYPILNCPDQIFGTFKIKLNNLVSQLSIQKENIWTVWGAKIDENASLIRKKTFFKGQLQISPQLLAQKHEHITKVETVICKRIPNEQFVQDVLHVLQEARFEIQRITKANPRLHPTGRLDAQIQYWDITGRSYNEQTLEAIDLHLIISGHQDVSPLSTKEAILPQSQVDLRLRCLHDPRNHITPRQADALGGTLAPTPIGSSSPLPRIPPQIRNHLREVMLNCGPFKDQDSLKNLFIVKELSRWRDTIPEAKTSSDRVDVTIDHLSQQNNGRKNGLISLLEVLRDRQGEGDDCIIQLDNRIKELKAHYKSSPKKDVEDAVLLRNQSFGLVNKLRQIGECSPKENHSNDN